MKKVLKLVRSYFTGTIFQQAEVKKQGPLMLLIFVWVIVIIYVAGSADYKIYRLRKLDDERRALKSEHVKYRTQLMEQTKPSTVIEEVEKLGLEPTFEAPQKIQVD
ncbi:MAG: FtsL-like putative cell division protein [Flavobacteriales bacterium]|jgi:hypothetical protein|nr:FtsL-like putative cell division protein [Flavobacteriales bacterium]